MAGSEARQQPNLPPGQYLADDFPVLSAGPTPRPDLGTWELFVATDAGARRTWSWREFRALPAERFTVDIHCVTRWSKLGTTWEGVPLDALLAGVPGTAGFALVHSYGGYTTNLPVADLRDGRPACGPRMRTPPPDLAVCAPGGQSSIAW